MLARPRIAVTFPALARAAADPAGLEAKLRLYVDALARHGAEPVGLDETTPAADRAAVFASMAGLLLAGGADIDPARYGQPNDGSREPEPARDALEAEAWDAAERRGLPVLGICRGLQAINVFSGGTLTQDVPSHEGPAPGRGPTRMHLLRLVPGSRLARILVPTNVGGGVLQVNSFHHQGVLAGDLAPSLVASGWTPGPEGELVEALEAPGGRFVVGVQCHPERTESTPPAFDRLWRFFVDACRGPAQPTPAGEVTAGSTSRR